MKPVVPAVVSKRTRPFRAQEVELPAKIRELEAELFRVFEQNPDDPRLKTSKLHYTDNGRLRVASYSVELTRRYRAIYAIDKGPDGKGPEQYCWYWIGSHEDYNHFTSSRR